MVKIHPAVTLDDDQWHDLPKVRTPSCLTVMSAGWAEPFRLRFREVTGWGPEVLIPAGTVFNVPGPTWGVFAQAKKAAGNTSVQVFETIVS